WIDGGAPRALAVGAVAAVVGNCWSLFLGFRGGKGVATGLGALLRLIPLATLAALPVFLVVVITTRFVSLGSLLGAACVPFGALVRLWARETEIVDGIRARRRNPIYMPDFDLPAGVEATGDVAAAVDGAEVIVMVVPSEFFAATLASVPARRETIIVSATKGFDPVRHVRMSELVRERFPQARVAALSGPTFARAVAQGSPTAAVIAAADDALTSMLQGKLGARAFRLYANRDIVGVEAGGAL